MAWGHPCTAGVKYGSVQRQDAHSAARSDFGPASAAAIVYIVFWIMHAWRICITLIRPASLHHWILFSAVMISASPEFCTCCTLMPSSGNIYPTALLIMTFYSWVCKMCTACRHGSAVHICCREWQPMQQPCVFCVGKKKARNVIAMLAVECMT